MKSYQHSDDKAFQQKLESHLPPHIPEELQWEHMSQDILAGLAARRKRRRFRWIWLPIFLLLGGIFTTLWWRESHPSSTDQTKSITFAQDTTYLLPAKPDPHISPGTEPKKSPPQSRESIEKTQKGYKKIPDAMLHPTEDSANLAPVTSYPLRGSGNGNVHTVAYLYFGDSSSSIPLVPAPESLESFEGTPLRSANISPSRKGNLGILGGINTFSQASSSPYETSLTGWVIGIRGQYQLNPSWSLQSGIELERLRYTYQKQYEEDIRLYRPGTVDTIFVNPRNGDSTFVLTDTIAGIRRVALKNFNSHYQMKLPLMLGYSLPLNRSTLSFYSGPVIFLYRNSTGFGGFEENELFEIPDVDLYTTGLSLGIRGEVQLEVPLQVRWGLRLHLSAEKSISNWVDNPALSPAIRPFTSSAKLGIYYRLGGGKNFSP